MSGTVIVMVEDLRTMLISSVRYALGRQSYIVSVTCDLVRQFAADTGTGKAIILRGIKEEIERADAARARWAKLKAETPDPDDLPHPLHQGNHWVGSEWDHGEWVKLVAYLEQSTNPKETP